MTYFYFISVFCPKLFVLWLIVESVHKLGTKCFHGNWVYDCPKALVDSYQAYSMKTNLITLEAWAHHISRQCHVLPHSNNSPPHPPDKLGSPRMPLPRAKILDWSKEWWKHRVSPYNQQTRQGFYMEEKYFQSKVQHCQTPSPAKLSVEKKFLERKTKVRTRFV